MAHHHDSEKTTWKNFIPLFVVGLFILGGTAILRQIVPGTDWMRTLTFFEGLMLAVFALFKLMDVKGFQEGYATYDLVAQRVPFWGYAYPFVEISLGALLLLGLWVVPVGALVAALAAVGVISVLLELRKKRAVRCACLGTALNVPLTSVTLAENGVMLVMALIMVAFY